VLLRDIELFKLEVAKTFFQRESYIETSLFFLTQRQRVVEQKVFTDCDSENFRKRHLKSGQS
jgi:hypothetical protein